MSPQNPPQGFVDNFIRLLADSDINDFQRVLEMKVSSLVFVLKPAWLHLINWFHSTPNLLT